MKKRITVTIDIESKYPLGMDEESVKRNILYELDSVPMSANIIDYKEELID